MKIVNPLYDKAFKYLMQNERFAKKILSIILDETVEELHLSQQETVVADEKRQLTLFRLDFKAIIKKPDGTRHKVLIELQKSKYITDIQRFRAYLGANYLKPEYEKNKLNEDIKVSYPIITIYILGYNVIDIPYLAVSVNHNVINSVNKKTLNLKSEFIELLNHSSHILQVTRLPEKRESILEKFLVLFNQAWCTEYKYILDLQDIPDEFAEIAKYLQTPLSDDEFRRQLEAEDEIDTIFERQEAKYIKQIEEAKQREIEAKQREEEAKQREEESRIKLVIKMKKYGEPIEDIIKETGLSKEQIDKL